MTHAELGAFPPSTTGVGNMQHDASDAMQHVELKGEKKGLRMCVYVMKA